MYVINTNSLNIFNFFFVVFHAESLINLSGAFYSDIFYFDIKEQILAFFTDSFEINFCRRDLRCLICGRGYVFSYFYSNKKSEDMI